MTDIKVYKADSRGHANHSWLDTWHSFSFASYYDPNRIHFGALRVLNDDTILPENGFGMHPHDNMEIITIALSGELEHQDSMGHIQTIGPGEVQVMSAGTGILHSEYNRKKDQPMSLLQIWIFPDKKNVEPRYTQAFLNSENQKDNWQILVSPYPNENGLWIHQDAWLFRGNFNPGKRFTYRLQKEKNGLFIFVIDGSVKVEGHSLDKRDALEIRNQSLVNFESGIQNTDILLIEVPLKT